MTTNAPLNRIVANASSASAGAFACQADDPRFADTGPIEHFLVYFPRHAVWIRHDGARPFVADLQLATIYNRGQRYTRRAIASAGDSGDWYAVSEELAREIVATFDPTTASDHERPFAFQAAPVDATLFLQQRIFSRQLRRSGHVALSVEEEILTLVSAVIGNAYRAQQTARQPPRRRGGGARQEVLVARAKEALLHEVAENTSVTMLAHQLNTSPFHLCRVFRAHTGLSLHQYRVQHRLRASIERVASRESLSTVAADLGFASHAHYTSVFRRQWRTTPSKLRLQIG